MKQKALHKFTFVSGGTKGFFLENSKKQTDTLFEQVSSKRNIKSDAIAAIHFNRQRATVLDVMVGCSLMEGTREVRLIPNWQLVRHPRRRFSLEKVLLEQDGE